MYHKAINLCGVLILAGTAFFWTAAPGQAAGHGGGHGGGGHGGFGGRGGFGGHGGFVGHSGFSGHSGFGVHRSFGGSLRGGSRSFGGAHISHFNGVGRVGHDFGRGRHDVGRGRHDFGRDWHNHGWFGSYYPGLYGYGGYPYYGSSPYPDDGYYGSSTYPDYGYDDGSYYDPGYDTSGIAPDYYSSPVYQDGGYATAPVSDNIAHLTVRVPSDAQVWLEDQATRQIGAVRDFVSPELAPGRNYIYDIRAIWQQSGRTVEQTRHVAVRGGLRVTVDFTQPAPEQPAASGSTGNSGS